MRMVQDDTTSKDEGHNGLTPKQTLLAQLRGVKNNYLLGFAATFLLRSPEANKIMRGQKINIISFDGVNTETLDLNHVREMLNDDERKKSATHNFLMLQVKISTSEPFELVKNYCERTCNMAKFESLEFYHFGRIIRNCLSHNNKLEFNRNDKKKKIFPVSWRNKTITENMDGKILEESVFDYTDVINLIKDYYTFVDDCLTEG